MAKDKQDVPYDAPWASDLAHRRDPNRVVGARPTEPAPFRPRSDSLPPDPATATPAMRMPTAADRAREPNLPRDAEPSYYDVSPLKRPLWKWEIATYFFLGGVSAGAYLVGRMAGRFGGGAMRDVSRLASYLALASILPAPPLLIADLGDPKRFHHMLRVWKPSNPMNLGTWVITAYGAHVAADAIGHALTSGGLLPDRERARLERLSRARGTNALLLVHDAAGVPLALLVASYTGVLISSTANPMWCRNPWLSPLFTASAISTGAEAVQLALNCTRRGRHNTRANRALRRIDTLAHVIELGCMAGYRRFAGEKARPLTQGSMKAHHRAATAGVLAAEALKLLPVPRRIRPARDALSNLCGIAGGLAMRWAMIYGAHEAADDPKTARLVSAPGDPANAPGPGGAR